MKIRFAELLDAETIAYFNQSMAIETEQLKIEKSVAIDGVCNLINQPQFGFYVVAEIANEVIGSLMITYEWSDWRNGIIWWLQSVYVKNELRKQGVFKNMLQFVEQQAKENNAVCIRLYMEKENTTAHETYNRCGFTKTDYFIFEKIKF